MKKIKMVAVLAALVLGVVITSCENPSGGSDSGVPEVQKDTLSEKFN